ncbi:MAG: Lycopene cyclase [Chloroflexi bacterium HGW-Chloroflexi-10]|nr:MAG: Lycopene cyclase [Chloroflexi bacterium HGW-Chloroflexi-10]
MPDYDFIFAGAGAAGLSLARSLLKSEALRGKKILLVEPDNKRQNDRTWCFWHPHAYGMESIAIRQWNQLQFVSSRMERVFQLAPYSYWMVRGIDYYDWMGKELTSTQVTRIIGRVEQVQDGSDSAVVWVDGIAYRADWVFDSRPPVFDVDNEKYHYLKQHFLGYLIETDQDVFDPQIPTLFDFRTPQNDLMRFFYVLPLSKRQALVEYTLFSAEVLEMGAYRKALSDYLRDVLHLKIYRVLEEEMGVIPMTDHPLPRQLGQRVLAIGTRGGRVKPSSGYAFKRIQEDSISIVTSLEQFGHPFVNSQSPGRYRLFDSIMLQVMLRNGGMMSAIFTKLFQNNSIQRIFAFLDERNTILQDLRLIASLPWLPFLRALWRIRVLKKI